MNRPKYRPLPSTRNSTLAWANIDPSGYAAVWAAKLSVRLGSAGLSADLRDWVNSGLMADLIQYAGDLGLDIEQLTRDLRAHTAEAKISSDIDSADLSGVSGTPTFFMNGKRHHGAYDIATLSDAVRAARSSALPDQAKALDKVNLRVNINLEVN
jgi:hypothetical protein